MDSATTADSWKCPQCCSDENSFQWKLSIKSHLPRGPTSRRAHLARRRQLSARAWQHTHHGVRFCLALGSFQVLSLLHCRRRPPARTCSLPRAPRHRCEPPCGHRARVGVRQRHDVLLTPAPWRDSGPSCCSSREGERARGGADEGTCACVCVLHV
jgi:hypothetical protein